MLTIVDVSNWQGTVNWERVAADGIRLAFVKATEGAHYTDAELEANRRRAEAVGVRVGFYAFARPGESTPQAQAERFCRAVGSLHRRELRPVLDLEVGNPRATEAFARQFNSHVRQRLGVWPLLYSYAGYLEAMRLRRPIGAGLWLASYGRDDGRDYGAAVPKPWRRWVAHQYTSAGRAPGIAGKVDFSHAPRLAPLLAHPVRGRL